jgi:hypothetical protein
LRSISAEHAATAADMVATIEDGEHRGVRPWAQRERFVEDPGERLRGLEDAALRALCRLARADDYDAVFRAVEDSGSAWLRAVMLNRAAETTLRHSARA